MLSKLYKPDKFEFYSSLKFSFTNFFFFFFFFFDCESFFESNSFDILALRVTNLEDPMTPVISLGVAMFF